MGAEDNFVVRAFDIAVNAVLCCPIAHGVLTCTAFRFG